MTSLPVPVSQTSYFRFERSVGAISALDGLRGIAVLLVLLRHATLPFQGQGEPILPMFGWDAATIFMNGWIGVDLFFVLSGFLIAHHIMNTKDRDAGQFGWRPYLSKRALRIVPAYLFVMFIVVAGLIPGYRIAEEHLGFRVGYHLMFLQDYLPANIVVSFWSLGVEEKFYLLAPFLILIIGALKTPNQRAIFLLSLVVLGLVLRSLVAAKHPEINSYQPFFPVFRSPFHLTMDGLVLGVLCATVYRDPAALTWLKTGWRPHLVFGAGCLVIGGLLAVENLLGSITLFDKVFQPTLIAVGFSAVLFGVLHGAGAGQPLKSDSLFFLSRISYPLYLIHVPLIPLALTMGGSEFFPSLRCLPFCR
ncbi:MAG: acyltransferase family protein [Alphaproteobacteria bacterium]|nr:acyltransferase family protein [Alphaproteobacteria bacterium]